MLMVSPSKIPMLDIDILEPGFTESLQSSKAPSCLATGKVLRIDEQHIRRMQDFHTKSELGLHRARTLDQYADTDLCGNHLERYNLDQVLSRWLTEHHAEKSQV